MTLNITDNMMSAMHDLKDTDFISAVAYICTLIDTAAYTADMNPVELVDLIRKQVAEVNKQEGPIFQ